MNGRTGLNDVLKTQPYGADRPLSSSGRKPATYKRDYAAYGVLRLPTPQQAVTCLLRAADPARHLAHWHLNRHRQSVPRTSSSGAPASPWTRSNPCAGTTPAQVYAWQVCLLGSGVQRCASCAARAVRWPRRRRSPRALREWRGGAVPAGANGRSVATS